MIIENKEIGVRFGVKGNEDFEKWLAEHDKQIKADHIREVEKKVRAEVIEKVKKYIRLKTKYAEHPKDDYVLAHEMYDWLDEQLKEQNK